MMMTMKHNIKIKQKWKFDIVDERTHIIEESHSAYNEITDDGLDLLAALVINNAANKYYSHCAIGTGTTDASGADTALIAESRREPIADSTSYSGTARITARFTHTGTDLDITEAGLFDGTGNTSKLLARVTTRSAAQLRNNKALTITITVSFSRT